MKTTFQKNIHQEALDGNDIILETLLVTVEFDLESLDEYGIDSDIVSITTEFGTELWEGKTFSDRANNVLKYMRSVSPGYYAEGEYFDNIDNWSNAAVSAIHNL